MSNVSLEQLKKVELETLLEVDRVCRENGIDYFLDSGTLLGAARHKGFIPWDDDIDISMPRKDYERFLAIAQRELGEGYFLQTRATDPEAPYSFAKVRKEGTSVRELAFSDRKMHTGIWIDIFPFDTIRNTEFNIAKKGLEWKIFHKMLTLRTADYSDPQAGAAKRWARLLLRAPLCLLPENLFYKILDGLGENVPETESAVWTCFHYYSTFLTLRNDQIFPLSELEFEGRMLPVMKDWNEYLTRVYGDWRTPPANKDRRGHGIEDPSVEE